MRRTLIVVRLAQDLKVAVMLDTAIDYMQPDALGLRAPTGTKMIERRQLGALGWRVVSISAFDWAELEGGEAQQACSTRYKVVVYALPLRKCPTVAWERQGGIT